MKMKIGVFLVIGVLMLGVLPLMGAQSWYDDAGSDTIQREITPVYNNTEGFSRTTDFDVESRVKTQASDDDYDKYKVDDKVDVDMSVKSVSAQKVNDTVDENIHLSGDENDTETFDEDLNMSGWVNITSVDSGIYDDFNMTDGFLANTSASNNVTINDNNITATGPDAQWISAQWFNLTVDGHQLRRMVSSYVAEGNDFNIYYRTVDGGDWYTLDTYLGKIERFQIKITLDYGMASTDPVKGYFGGEFTYGINATGSEFFSNNNGGNNLRGMAYNTYENCYAVALSNDTIVYRKWDGAVIQWVDTGTNQPKCIDIGANRTYNSATGEYERTMLVGMYEGDYIWRYKISFTNTASGLDSTLSKVGTYTPDNFAGTVRDVAVVDNDTATGEKVGYYYLDRDADGHRVGKFYLSNGTVIFSCDKDNGNSYSTGVIPDIETGGAYCAWGDTVYNLDADGGVIWSYTHNNGNSFAPQIHGDKERLYLPNNTDDSVDVYDKDTGNMIKNIAPREGITALKADGNGHLYISTDDYSGTVADYCIDVSTDTKVWRNVRDYGNTGSSVMTVMGSYWHAEGRGNYNPYYISEDTIGVFKSVDITWQDTVDMVIGGDTITAKDGSYDSSRYATDISSFEIYNYYGGVDVSKELVFSHPLKVNSSAPPIEMAVNLNNDTGAVIASKMVWVEYGTPINITFEGVDYTNISEVHTFVMEYEYNSETLEVDYSGDTITFSTTVHYKKETVSSGFFNFVSDATFWALLISLLVSVAVGAVTRNADVSGFTFVGMIVVMWALGFVHQFVLYITLFSFGLLFVIKTRSKKW